MQNLGKIHLKSEITSRSKLAYEFLIEKCNKLIHPQKPLRDAVLHHFFSQGKGLRPALAMLACGAVGGIEKKALPVAASVEALHVSSLIHDDWMDNDKVRRSQKAVWVKWNPTVAVLAGDALLGFSFRILGFLDVKPNLNFIIANELARCYLDLCSGQMLDVKYSSTPLHELDSDSILNMQFLKTGSLFEYSALAGTAIGVNSISHSYTENLKEFASSIGVAFQIRDDVLSLVGDENLTGKPTYSDLREGKRTLILLYGVQNADNNQKTKLMEIVGDKKRTRGDFKWAYETLKSLGAIDYTQKTAKALADTAHKNLNKIPETKKRNVLLELANYMIKRDY